MALDSRIYDLDPEAFAESLELLPPYDARLLVPTSAVHPKEIATPHMQAIMDKLACEAEKGVGASARQFYSPKYDGLEVNAQIIAIDTNADPRDWSRKPVIKTYVNLEFLELSDRTQITAEGCFSMDPELVVLVERPQGVAVRAFDRTSSVVTEPKEGFQADAFQHEKDHDYGTLAVELITDPTMAKWVSGEAADQAWRELGIDIEAKQAWPELADLKSIQALIQANRAHITNS